MAILADLQYYTIFFILSFISTLLLRSFLNRITKPTTRLHLPPSPPTLPIIGHLHLLSSSIYKSFHSLSTQYGPLLYLHIGASRCLLVSSAAMAAEMFKTNDLAFASRPKFNFVDKLPYGTSSFITAEYGDYWRFMKKLCMTELLGVKKLERSRAVRREELHWFLKKSVESGKNGKGVDVGAEVMKLTNNMKCRVVMSTRCSEDNDEAERLIKLVKESCELVATMCFGDVLGPLKKLGFWVYGRKVIDIMPRYDEILEKILKEHEERGKREDKDLMDVLLEVYQDDKAQMKLTRTHIKAFVLELFGTESVI